MTNYENTIERLDCYPEQAGETDVVFTIYWRMNASEDNYYATAYGSCAVTWAEGEPFTPYADLTFEQVWGWVAEKINMNEIKATLDKQIEQQVNPPAVSLPLPWATPTPLAPPLP